MNYKEFAYLSEGEVVRRFTFSGMGMVFGYTMYNQRGLTTQVPKQTHIYTSLIDEEEVRIGRIVLHRCKLVFTKDVTNTIEMLDILTHQNEIEDLNTGRFRSLSEAFKVKDIDAMLALICAHLSYPTKATDALRKIVADNLARRPVMKQLIIVRKDLNMSPGKLAAQCCHASMAFLTHEMMDRDSVQPITRGMLADFHGTRQPDWDEIEFYEYDHYFEPDVYEGWIAGIFTKIICEARNKNHLMRAVEIANELGLKENEDFFVIKDACLTELLPEEMDKNGVGRTTTCIGFRPLREDIMHQISKKYQLLR